MRTLRRTSQFKKDAKRVLRRGWEFSELEMVVRKLFAGERLHQKHRDHALGGEYKDCRECPIASDWLLIYRVHSDEIVLIRTGSHSDLFE